jgi:multiple sugar transport system ATP-binding protein
MRSEIKKLHQKVGKTTVYVTHDQVEAMTLANRIAVMFRGVLQQYDTPKVIYEQPVNTFVAGFMGSPTMNFLRATISPDLGVILDGGDAVLPLQADQTRGVNPGQKVTLGIRPEHFHPVADRRAERRGGQSGLVTVKVALVEPTGSETILVAKLAGQEVTIACEPDDTPPVGVESVLAIDMTKVCLFDPTSGSRL